jgi:cyclopropane fatty-acyl-phospholipid synthase-like methyltransferase
VLDVGSGRGIWLRKMVKLGLRVIGIDIVQDIVDTANEDIKSEDIADRARFMLGDVLDIPFTPESFDAVTDIGLLQHLDKVDWDNYVAEIHRVLKPGGYLLNVSLSRETTRFLDHNPKTAPTGDFEKFGLQYYFFKRKEIKDLFQGRFVVAKQMVRHFDARTEPHDGVALVFTLLQKK